MNDFNAAKTLIWAMFIIGSAVSVLATLTLFLQICDYLLRVLLKKMKAYHTIFAYAFYREEFKKWLADKRKD